MNLDDNIGSSLLMPEMISKLEFPSDAMSHIKKEKKEKKKKKKDKKKKYRHLPEADD